MIKKGWLHVRGAFVFSLHTINTLAICTPVFLLSIVKFLLPILIIRKGISYTLNFLATLWISINSLITYLFNPVKIDVKGINKLSTKDWYMVISNHQSWVDIFVLQQTFNRQIPFLKFFLKKELFWFPVLGIAWWALDFPFMKRYSKSYLKKNPHKKGKDLETTRKVCEKFKHIPISVMNFVEGTRFSAEKHKRQDSPFKHLLKPKSGGVGTVLSILGEQMQHVVDVTIVYPEGNPSFWDYMCGKVNNIKVFVNIHPIESQLVGDMSTNESRKIVQTWLNGIWREKDALISQQLELNDSVATDTRRSATVSE